MTITLVCHKPKATRTQTLRLVPSQFTERIQARSVPEVWPAPTTLLERVTEWYCARRWPAAVMVVFGVIVAAATIAAWIVTL